MRPPCIACLNKLSWGNRFSALLLLCVATAIASPAQNLRQAAQPRQACGLGIRWNEEESGLPSIWTRRGTGDVFDVSYPTARVTTVNTVKLFASLGWLRSMVYAPRPSGDAVGWLFPHIGAANSSADRKDGGVARVRRLGATPGSVRVYAASLRVRRTEQPGTEDHNM
jgi:hypothetical protein